MSGRAVAPSALAPWVLATMASALVGCAASAPVTMPAEYRPAYEPARAASTNGSTRHAAATCAVRIAEVLDQRTDPHVLGDTVTQPVRVENSADWISSALRSLDGQSGLEFVDRPAVDGRELVMSVELLKAYTVHLATDRAATVVIRVKYSRGGTPIDEQIYRGATNGLNWSNGAGETLASLNDALGKLLKPVREDISRHCLGGWR